MSCIPFRNKSLHTQRTAYVSPPIQYIHLYKSLHRISPLHCELQILTRLFSGALYLEAEILTCLGLPPELRGLTLWKLSLMSTRPYQNRLCQSKMIDLEHVFPLLCSLKNVHDSMGVNLLFAQIIMTARCLKCSVSARV